MKLNSLIDALEDCLRQEQLLVSDLSDHAYQACGNGHFKSSVGKHIRHNLDHFVSFFAGLADCSVDYERRSRDLLVETERSAAKALLEAILRQLQDLRGADDRAVSVREESDDAVERPRVLTSSIGRELQFLLGHTVHHHAIIAMLLAQKSLPISEGFGVAPSTKRHEAMKASPVVATD